MKADLEDIQFENKVAQIKILTNCSSYWHLTSRDYKTTFSTSYIHNTSSQEEDIILFQNKFNKHNICYLDILNTVPFHCVTYWNQDNYLG